MQVGATKEPQHHDPEIAGTHAVGFAALTPTYMPS